MKVQILNPGKNVTLGSGLLRILQNNHTPKADLFIREAIQNSLDAAKEDTNSVHIDINIGNFDSDNLTSHLEYVGPKILDSYPGYQKYLSIRDFNTKGLVGPLSHDGIDKQDFGNLVKLIYDLAKPQENTEAGGSWGYGKTIFYRMGIGLVIYYTRIFEDGEYKSRLAIAMVEDEGGTKTYIPPNEGLSTLSGVAWWGDLDSKGESIPITDENSIKKILDIFDIEPYNNDKTGTSIIIPYIDEDEIMKDNAVSSQNDSKANVMYEDLEEYLKISVQRWYAPRLNNVRNIYNEKFLTASVNNEKIEYENMDDYFKLIQGLYNYAIGIPEDQISLSSDTLKKINRESIKIQSRNGVKVLDNEVGHVSYGKFNYQELGMLRVHDSMDPYYLSNITLANIDELPALFTYTRRPGMFVNYEVRTDWSNNISSDTEGDFIIGVFVLKSNTNLDFNGKEVTIDEYIRQGEQSDHIVWEDHSKYGQNPNIVGRIKNHVRNKMAATFIETPEESITTNDGRLGIKASTILLPPTHFGKQASKPKTRTSISTKITKRNNAIIKIHYADTKYEKDSITIPFDIKITGEGVRDVCLTLKIGKEGGSSSISKFEKDVDEKSPIEISEAHVMINRDIKYEYKEGTSDMFDISNSELGTTEGLTIMRNLEKNDVLTGNISISNSLKSILPVFDISVKEVE